MYCTMCIQCLQMPEDAFELELETAVSCHVSELRTGPRTAAKKGSALNSCTIVRAPRASLLKG